MGIILSSVGPDDADEEGFSQPMMMMRMRLLTG